MTTKNSPAAGAFRDLTVAVDAINISLARGTGIATYARGLADTLLENGASVDFLFDRPITHNRRLDEGSAFDAQTDAAPPTATSRLRRLAGLGFDRGVKAVRASRGTVRREAYADRLPVGAGVAIAPDLGGRSELLFRRAGLFLPVRLSPAPRVAHWTTPFAARVAGAINIATIHDLVPLQLPAATLDSKEVFFRLAQAIARRADHVLAVSEAARRELVATLPLDPERSSVLYPRVEPDAAVAAESDGEIAAFLHDVFSLNYKNYFLFFGSIEPKKNIAALLEAYAGADVQLPLVIVSALAWLSERDLTRLAPFADGAPAPLAANVRRLDYVPRRDLARLMRGARAIMLASAVEGFGLPIAEAAGYGVPAITSRGGAMQEVAGDGAILVDPFDVRDIRAALIALAEGRDRAENLGAQARREAERFSGPRHLQALCALYQRLGLL